MAHFAKIDNLGVVVFVTVGSDDEDELSLCARTGDTYRRTSYNTHGGVHYGPDGKPDGGVAFRKNFAGVGYTYDKDIDAFIPPKPYKSWLLNEECCIWEPPIPCPNDGNTYKWDEESTSWIKVGR
jgi:hypothetical protein